MGPNRGNFEGWILLIKIGLLQIHDSLSIILLQLINKCGKIYISKLYFINILWGTLYFRKWCNDFLGAFFECVSNVQYMKQSHTYFSLLYLNCSFIQAGSYGLHIGGDAVLKVEKFSCACMHAKCAADFSIKIRNIGAALKQLQHR